jgi:superfamily I DNA/RNA helicase
VRWLVGGTSHSLADQAAELHGREDDSLRAALSPGDVAVLVRFKGLITPIKRTLDRLGLPCSAPEAEAFWVEPRAEAILAAAGAFLGVAHMQEASEAACPDKILAKGPLAVAAYMEETPPFDRLFWQSPAFRDLAKAYEEHGGWAGLLNWIHLQSLTELAGRRSEKIRIMSLHAAKGLEFRAVFLPALEDGILPFAGMNFLRGKPADELEPDVEEERRLFYVGLTRAKDALYLSHAAQRMLYGREVRLKPTRFLDALPQDAVKRSTLKAHSRRKEKPLSFL